MKQQTRRIGRKILRGAAEALVAVYVVGDGIVAPLFGPVMRFLSSLGLIRRLEEVIARLPPYVILALLVVPFIVAEFFKAYGILLLAEDRIRAGLAVLAAAYVVSILVCQRIFFVGRKQLLTIGWFKVAFERAMSVKDRVLAWMSRTGIWRFAEEMREKIDQAVLRVRTRLRMLRPTRKPAVEQR